MIYYNLNKNIPGDKILQDIQKLLTKFPQDEIKNMTLTISLQKIVDYAGDSPLPKINYESNSLT
jgi:hypothetical protein